MRPTEIISIILTALLCACSDYNGPGSLEYALDRAAGRRGELERLLQHYADDPEKRLAAEYLISAMPFHGTKEGPGLDTYIDYYRMFAEMGKEALPLVDSLQRTDARYNPDDLKLSLDIENISADYLIREIDAAYAIRRSTPWGKSVDHDNFIKYVLPYRVGSERLENWRDSVLTGYGALLDSLRAVPSLTDPRVVAGIILDKWNEKEYQWTGQLPGGPGIGVKNVWLKAGTCLEFTHGLLYLLRAFGIPCGVESVDVRSENNSVHFWPFMIDANGDTWATDVDHPYWVKAPDYEIYAGKISRSEFNINPAFRGLGASASSLPANYLLPLFSDVTGIYKPSDSFTIDFPEIKCDSPVFLAFSRNKRWLPMDVCADGKNVKFHHVGGDIVGIVGKWKDGRLEPLSYPFYIGREGSLREIRPDGRRGEVTAYSKHPMKMRNGDFVGRLLGGVVEGADNPRFDNAVVVYTITDWPHRKYNTGYISHAAGPFRYYRYRGADGTHCNIADLALYEGSADSVAMSGRAFGTPGDLEGDGSHEYANVFDGDALTSFNYKESSGGWAALDLGRPRTLGKVVYVGRNRDNYVNNGDIYELHYFGEKGWTSLGVKKGVSDSVTYRDAPLGALYYLQDHTRDRFERIFEYDPASRRQIFW